MTIIQYIRDFIKICPYLDEYHQGIGVDYLREDATAYMIESVPADPIVKKYTDGGSIRQFAFNFSSREPYGSDVLENLDNIGFFEHFSEWLEIWTNSGALPVMNENQMPLSIQATTPGYMYNNELDKAQYVIQCNFKYKQEA